MEVWVLSHEYDYGDIWDKYKWNSESRFLGVYYTKKQALKELEKYKKIRGFCLHSDSFFIEKYKLNKTLEWEGEFTTYFKNTRIKEERGEKVQKIYVLSHFYYEGYEKIEKHRILYVTFIKKEIKEKIEEYKKIRGFSSCISNFYVEVYHLL